MPAAFPTHRQGGFTLTEVLVAVAVSVTLGAIVFALVAGTMAVSAKTETRAAQQNKASTVLTDITDVVDATDTVITATRSVLMVDTRTSDRCVRHEFRLTPDPMNLGRLAMQYTRIHVGLPTTADCDLVRDSLDAGGGTFEFVYEVSNLHPASGFTYYDTTGARAWRPGEANFSPSTAVHPCYLGRVNIHLIHDTITRDGAPTQTNDIASGLLRGNITGTGACYTL